MSLTGYDNDSRGKESFGVTKLRNRDGYPLWSFSMGLALKKFDKWSHVNGDKPRPTIAAPSRPTDAETSALQEWQKVDDSTKAHLVATLADSQRTLIAHLGMDGTAKQYWDYLAAKHKPKGDSGYQALYIRLQRLKYKEGDSMENHLSSIIAISDQMAIIGQPLPDSQLNALIMLSLPESWDAVQVALDDGQDRAVEETMNRLSAEAERRALRASVKESKRSNAGALSAQQGEGKGPECWHCHERGHVKRECPKKGAKGEGEKGEKGGKGGGKKFGAKSAKGEREEYVHTLSITIPDALVDTKASLCTHPEHTEHWVVDSGAGKHFTGRLDSLSDFVSSPLTVEVANGRRLVAPGYGKATLKTGQHELISLAQVYYLPEAKMGLLSVTAVMAAGGKVVFEREDGSAVARITKDGREVGRTVGGTGLVLDAELVVEANAEQLSAISTRVTAGAPLATWHRRLGHLAYSTILDMARLGTVEGVVLTDKKEEDCESCLATKSHRSPFSAKASKVDAPLARLYIDLGFVDQGDRLGRKIYMAIADQFSAAKWSFPLSSKEGSVVLATWLDFKANVDKDTGYTIKRLRSDNGGEFVNAEFEAALVKSGITHERTAPYTPEQNGQVERLNGSLIATVKAMLHDSQLGKEHWSDALAMATFVANRTIHGRLEGKSPYEVMYGKKPVVKHFKPFGARCWVHKAKELRRKLDDSAEEGILIGYDGEYNYKVLMVDSQKVVVTRHASFGRKEEHQLSEEAIFEFAEPFAEPQVRQDSPPDSRPNSPEHAVHPGVIHKDGYDYFQTKTGPNPGRFEEVDPSNIIEGRRRRAGATYSVEDDVVYARIIRVVDDVAPVDGPWEEEWVLVGVPMAGVPRSIDEALASEEAALWEAAMNKEYDAFERHGVLKPVKLPKGARKLRTRWVLTVKPNGDKKARWVVDGSLQRPGFDVFETFAPVARMSTIRSLFAVAAAQDLHLAQFDFETAFLNGKIHEDIYISIPRGYPGKYEPGDVLKLIGAMYGTKQAPREWNAKLDAVMAELSWTKSKADVCLYIKLVKGSLLTLVVWVDDGVMAGKNAEVINAEIDSLNAVCKLKRMGRPSCYLSLEFTYTDSGIVLHQTKYAKSVLSRFESDFGGPLKPRSTPMDPNLKVDLSSPLFGNVPLYQSVVGALQYSATTLRADMAATVRFLAQKVKAPTEQDWCVAKHAMRYLAGTVEWGIKYEKGGSTELEVYPDASWADDPETRKSVGAFVVLIAGGAVSWRSKQQSLVATSTTEAELTAVSDATKEVIALRSLAADFGIPQLTPTNVYEAPSISTCSSSSFESGSSSATSSSPTARRTR